MRPVRLGDQLEQAQENLAIMRLPDAGRTSLPYQMDSLAWNKQHTANEQVGLVCTFEGIMTPYRGNTATVEPQESGTTGWFAVRVAPNGSTSAA